MQDTVNEMAQQVLDEKSELVKQELDNFFVPVSMKLEEEWLRAKRGEFDEFTTEEYVRHFFSVIEASPSISSVYISDTSGNQIFAGQLDKKGGWYSASTFLGNSTDKGPDNRAWKIENDSIQLVTSSTRSDSDFDPRVRPWFINSINCSVATWTPPYSFEAADEPGITVTKRFSTSKKGPQVISMDITLTDLSIRTAQMNICENGKAFILTDSGKFVGLPKFERDIEREDILPFALTNIQDFNQTEVVKGYDVWLNENRIENSFQFKDNGIDYWIKIVPYQLGNLNFNVGVLAPENDIAGPIKRTKTILFFGMIFILIVFVFIVQAYRSKNRINRDLEVQKSRIEAQKKIVDQKNHEIIDSINYAKRIQTAILPPLNEIQRKFPKSFVFYRPKDIVAGDFYWMLEVEDYLFIAAADCTGHGVPGAMVSVICNGGLNRAVREFGLRDPGKILDKTREIVIAEFEKSEDEVKDGMDIALCCIQGGKLKYAGAHNPLWVVRKSGDAIEEIKANKQPIGKFDELKSYTTHEFSFEKGDRFYLLTDGFADQFGGEKGKKFKGSKLKELFLSMKETPIQDQNSKLGQVFDEWCGSFEQIDDVCVIGFEP